MDNLLDDPCFEISAVDNQLLDDFNNAANYIEGNISKLSPNQLLELYGLYKQATIGKCNTSKPSGLFNLQNKSKWSAWNSLKDMPKNEAMELYIKKAIHYGWNRTSTGKTSWVCHSICSAIEEAEISDSDKTPFDYVKEKNLEKLKSTIRKSSIDKIDETGLGLIHWATDRNAVDILGYLISSGANINLQDNDKQTALHYASSCGHLDCLNLLIKYGANRNIQDDEGNTCADVAFDENVKLIIENS